MPKDSGYYFMNRALLIIFTGHFLLTSCTNPQPVTSSFQISDPNLTMTLVADENQIQTPIGLAIDKSDNLYVIESHTHTPPEDYQGPKYDRVKRGMDKDGDGIPESWTIYADSIEDGMNLTFGPEKQLFVTTKDAVWALWDEDGDGTSERRELILEMITPESPYDHAAILGVAVSPDNQWLFVSRGNTGSWHWIVRAKDGSSISGYGDGGNVMRCRLDGSEIEEVATGFWNPFDIKFTVDGRLLLTDNDPDSRGPNRLIEIVPGGDYGYKSLYGGSGLHPFVAWNGELPGTLPYAAPLGEAPCALLDPAFTGFGSEYLNTVLVNIWEEKNIVRIPTNSKGSTISGVPEVLVQGDSTFHPVALVPNSKGEVYITDWVKREYPNHGQGKIWKLSGKHLPETKPAEAHYKFKAVNSTFEELKDVLSNGDSFLQASARFVLSRQISESQLTSLLTDTDPELKIQGLLVAYKMSTPVDDQHLRRLLRDASESVRQTTLFYLGTKQVTSMLPEVERSLKEGLITADMFETYLATIQNLQTDFVQGYQQKNQKANRLKRPLPENFIEKIVANRELDESIRGLALPYLEHPERQKDLFLEWLQTAKSESFQLSLINAMRNADHAYQGDPNHNQVLLQLVSSEQYSDKVRSHALAALYVGDDRAMAMAEKLANAEAPVLKFAAAKYLGSITGKQQYSKDQYQAALNKQGDPHRGELVFKARASMCQTCHKVDGWGGNFGPDLTNIGSSKTQQQLMNSILNPSLEMAPEWQGWYVIDQDGNRHIGRQIDVHLKNVELMNINGEFVSYRQPRSYGVADESVMPAGLQNSMTLSEFNDLIAYLISLK